MQTFVATKGVSNIFDMKSFKPAPVWSYANLQKFTKLELFNLTAGVSDPNWRSKMDIDFA